MSTSSDESSPVHESMPEVGGAGTIEGREGPEQAPTLFESAAWQHVMEKTYDFTFHRAHHPDTSITLPFATMNRALRQRAVSLPFSDYVATDEASIPEYRRLANVVCKEYPNYPLILKTTFPHDTEGLGTIERKAYYHQVDTSSRDTMLSNLTSSYRNKVRQAQRADITTEISISERSMDVFYDLHKDLRFGKFGKVPQPRRFFGAIREEFCLENRGFVMKALRKGEVIGALVALRHRDVLYYKFSASAKEHLEHRPNNLLTYHLLCHAEEEGCEAVDLGLSGAGPSYKGLRKFKESFGGRPSPVTTLRIDPPDYDRAPEEELDQLLGRLTETIASERLDSEVTDAFSEQLYPYFA